MKTIAMLIAMTFLVAACNDEERKALTHNHPETSRIQDSQILTGPNELHLQKPLETQERFLNAAPPKPITKGAYDFSECKEKYGSGTKEFRKCVQAKYPNMKFVE
ncbi:MAG: hypothetical protein MJZ10_05565 [Fibrobacter sp.]|nr:hypothetical protein [Fibrobacter sp.]